MPVVDRTTGEVREAQVFVGILGASNLTYAEATWSQEPPQFGTDLTGTQVFMVFLP